MSSVYYKDGVEYYNREVIQRMIEGQDSVKPPLDDMPKPIPEPISPPEDPEAFARMFYDWMINYYRLKTRRAEPGAHITRESAGILGSEQIATYPDGATGILTVDGLGQAHFLSSAMEHASGPSYPNTPSGSSIAPWITADHIRREGVLRSWWEDGTNSQAAFNFQRETWLKFSANWTYLSQYPIAFQKTQQIFASPFREFQVNSTSTGTNQAADSALTEKMKFDDLVRSASDQPKMTREPRRELTPASFEYISGSSSSGLQVQTTFPAGSKRRLSASSLQASGLPTCRWIRSWSPTRKLKRSTCPSIATGGDWSGGSMLSSPIAMPSAGITRLVLGLFSWTILPSFQRIS